MKKIKFLCFFVSVLMSHIVFAQKHATTSAKQIIEKGTQGDIILGNENKKNQLSSSIRLNQMNDSMITKEHLHEKKKRNKRKKCKSRQKHS